MPAGHLRRRSAAAAVTMALLAGYGTPALSSDSARGAGMARLPGGTFPLPFKADTGGATRVRVAPYHLDKSPVSTADFLAFVKASPRFARSRIGTLFADGGYLKAWSNDTTPPATATAATPIVSVSWYAASAYCRSLGKRLPTTAEWELAAASRARATDSGTFEQTILAWYARPAGGRPPRLGEGTKHAAGVRDLHGVIWEWTSDYNAWNGAGVARRGRTDELYDERTGGLACGGAAAAMKADVPYATYMRWAFRGSLKPDYTVATLGFRCAAAAPGHEP